MGPNFQSAEWTKKWQSNKQEDQGNKLHDNNKQDIWLQHRHDSALGIVFQSDQGRPLWDQSI